MSTNTGHDYNSNKKMIIDAIYCNNANVLHKGENCHSKNTEENDGFDNEKLISNRKAQMKDELKEHEKEQKILLKENKQTIIDFLLGNKDSLKIDDLKIYEPVYKCYREKGYCFYCNTTTNIICINCNNYNKVWLCANHWRHHEIEKHE